jgi:hypothetical protein
MNIAFPATPQDSSDVRTSPIDLGIEQANKPWIGHYTSKAQSPSRAYDIQQIHHARLNQTRTTSSYHRIQESAREILDSGMID